MNTQDFKRRLTAILSADVEGYSRLMREDEEATVRTITSYRTAMTHLIEQYRGRVVDSPGDILAEFSSVVDAVCCAVEVQKEIGKQNAELLEHRKMKLPIGVNLGDVIEKEDTIYGDGVDIAARLEAMARGGGICISETAFDQVESKIGLEFEYLGEQAVKNIKKPVQEYRFLEMSRELPLPDKPSIAVLPFVNMNGDPEQEYFSDGMSKDIITVLSQLPKVFVIARNSVFVYKGRSVNVQQERRDLGVQYVLESSVRKVGQRVRITAQLIDATPGHHIWAERYDPDLEDIFAIQGEITLKILTPIQVKLTDGGQARLYARGTENIEAHLKMGQATDYFFHADTGSNFLVRQICKEVISMESNWDAPYCLLGWTHWQDVWLR